MTLKKPVTITAHNRTLIHEESEFIIHTATSCYLIDEVLLTFKYQNFEEGMELADVIRKSINEWFENKKPRS